MIITPDQAGKSVSEKHLGGVGKVSFLSYINKTSRPKDSKFSLAAEITIDVDSTIGYHTHPTNQEIYLIVKGTGIYVENDKSEHPVGPGDLTFCPQGEGHALINKGQDPLVFLAFITE
jgi:mannose-6-phosphate isomerase-like protein (cupin superfamily)